MIDVRRWYLYLVSAITVQAVTWSLIALIRHLLLKSPVDREIVALELAAIIVTLPLFLAHWLWAQRLAGRGDGAGAEERASFPRRLYLYGMLAAFMVPIMENGLAASQALMHLVLGVEQETVFAFEHLLTNTETFLYALPALVVPAALWGYHWIVMRGDDRRQEESEASAVLSRLYQYGFAAAGLIMVAVAVGMMLAWLFGQLLPGREDLDPARMVIAANIPLLAVGLAVWLPFWLPVQRRFAAGDRRERASVVRKAFLYIVVFGGALGVIGTTSLLLADLIARGLGVPTEAGGLSTALAVILVCSAVWAYHAFVLRRDAAAVPEVAEQALVRRIYIYLMAGLGLAAMLIGLGGTLATLFEGLHQGIFSLDLRESISGFIASFIAGLPVWFWHWRQAVGMAAQPAPAGTVERRSFVRRLYLYLFIFVATLTILGSVIFIVSQLLMLLLGERTTASLFYELAQAFSFTAIAMAVWVYHGLMLRQDGRAIVAAEAAQRKALHIAVVDAGDGSLGQTLATRLHDHVPGAIIQPVGLSPAAMATMYSGAMNGGTMNGGRVLEKSPAELIGEAELIVGPWSMAVPAGHGGIVSADLAAAITASPAQKILLPEPEPGYSWAGVEKWQVERIAGEVVESARAFSLGEQPAGSRPAPWATVLLVVGAVVVLALFLPAFFSVLFGF